MINNMIKKLSLVSLIMLNLLILSACEDSRNLFASEDIVDEGWAAKPQKFKPKKTYCYKTLAGIDCYDEPQKGEETRLVEKYDEDKQETDKT